MVGLELQSFALKLKKELIKYYDVSRKHYECHFSGQCWVEHYLRINLENCFSYDSTPLKHKNSIEKVWIREENI